ncbi:hypothetical protein RUM43_007940 [Polyplax serrata]|uniref:Uncharacterized protein n=1 Tax=Polyplax serrata TaxID=468196 RepID=A0AAN8PY81_POLSC
MDLQTCLLCIVIAILSGAILLFISMFGMKEKTYEEAIAEQRKMPDDALLLGRPSKDKTKNKKQKRQGKKVKEKTGTNKVVNKKKNTKTHALSASKSKLVHKAQEKSKVSFITSEILSELIPFEQSTDKKKLKEKSNPTLANKKESAPTKERLVQKDMTDNHFSNVFSNSDLEPKITTSKNNQKKIPKDQANTKENLGDKGLKVKEKTDLKSPLKESNNKVDSEKNYKNDSNVENKNDNLKIEKIKSDNNQKLTEDKGKVEKAKEVKIKIEKVKDEKSISNDRIKNEKLKTEEYKFQQQHLPFHQQQKPQIEVKHVRTEVNGNTVPSMQLKKVYSHQNNKDLKNKNHKKNELISLQHMNLKFHQLSFKCMEELIKPEGFPKIAKI